MESRFGFKDFVLFAMIVGIGLMVFLVIWQRDRQFTQLRSISDQLSQQSTALASLNRTLERGLVVSAPTASAQAAQASPSGRDESWARPGVPVTWPEPWGPANDPRDEPDFAMGGTLTEIFEGVPRKLTPFTLNEVYINRIVQEVICESLAMFASDTLDYHGWLAEAWQYDPNGLWLRVKIHDDARFSDGQPVTAEDVRFTYMDYIHNPEIEAQEFVAQTENVQDVVVVSEKVCDFLFKDAAFDNLYAALRFSILPKHYYSQFTPSQLNQSTGLAMGSGPYRFEITPSPANQWAPGQPVVLVRNENYWRDPPFVDRHRYTFIQDNVARLTAFDNGDGDIMRSTPNQTALKLSDPEWLEGHTARAWPNMRSGYAIVAFNCGERNGRPTPFSDKRVRLGMTHLIDRDRVNRDFYEGLGEVATGPFPPGQGDDSIEAWPYDVERAVELFAEAGWIDRDGDGFLDNERGDRFTFEFIYTTGSSIGPRLSRYMSDQCERVGIEVTIRVVDWSMLESIRDARDFDTLIQAWSWTSPESDVYQLFHSSQIENQGDNWIQYTNTEADALMERGKREVDANVRKQIWADLHRALHEDQPYMFMMQLPWLRFTSNRVKNIHEYPVGINKMEMYIPLENQR